MCVSYAVYNKLVFAVALLDLKTWQRLRVFVMTRNKTQNPIYQHFLAAMKEGGPDSYETSSDGVACGRFAVQDEDIEALPELRNVEFVLIWDGGFETSERACAPSEREKPKASSKSPSMGI